MAFQITKKNPKKGLSNHVPMPDVPATPPSGDSLGYRFVYLHYSITYPQCQIFENHAKIRKRGVIIFSLKKFFNSARQKKAVKQAAR